MAATDQHYRSQKTLDIVFGVSCGLMLLTTVWMFWQDYAREYKSVQRTFRDVEAAIAERDMIDKMPDVAVVRERREALEEARRQLAYELDKVTPEKNSLEAKRERADDRARGIKADVDAQGSYYNIAIDEVGKVPEESNRHKALMSVADREKKKLEDLEKKLEQANADLAAINLQIKKEVRDRLEPLEKKVADADESMKRITATFDRFAKQAAKTNWTAGDTFRALPIIDGFESPTKIKQLWLPDLTIEYGSFREVPRYDRCTTCHLGIDRGTYDKAALAKLGDDQESSRLTGKLVDAQKMLERRAKAGENLGFDPKNLPGETANSMSKISLLIFACVLVAAFSLGILERSIRLGMYVLFAGTLVTLGSSAAIAFFARVAVVKTVKLDEGQVSEYCAHPRLDVFVDSNSPHPMEKFGCTTCHAGQGSATDFINASHSPNGTEQEKHWAKKYGWEPPHAGELPPNYHWDFPMLQKRFVESTCLKCHHQVTDLIRSGNKEEAPKLLRGYNLIKENGCFGCHEIQGIKSNRPVGPDLRTEPSPALEWLSPAEQERIKADTANPPGNLRKVGPSLRRLSEKVGQEWTRKWINAPRDFREDTRMPHFYNLTNNIPGVLPEDQKDFPAVEMHAISYYLQTESQKHLKNKDFYRESLLGDSPKVVMSKERLAYVEAQLNADPSKEEKPALEAEKATLVRDGAATPIRRGIHYIQVQLSRRALSDRDIKELFDLSKRFSDLALLSSPTRASSINAHATRQRQLQEQLQDLHKTLAVGPNDKLKEQVPLAASELLTETAAIEAEATPTPLTDKSIRTDEGAPVTLPQKDGDASKGRLLFTEKGCLACHAHQGTTTKDAANGTPGVSSKANFGPELSRIADKLLMGRKPAEARLWLVQWVMNPNVYHPRTRMPVTHLSAADANDVAAWLLSQKSDWQGADPGAQVNKKALRDLTRVHLARTPGLTKAEMNAAVPKDEKQPANGISADRVAQMPRDMDERELVDTGKSELSAEAMLWYVGKRAVGRLGCFGCHDIPGFETAKPTGTGLNDWGKKDHDKLAFEDGESWAKEHFTVVPSRLTRKKAEGQVLALWKKGGEKLDESKKEGERSEREKFNDWLATVKDVTKTVKTWSDRSKRIDELKASRDAAKKKLADAKDDEKKKDDATTELNLVEGELLLATAEDRLGGASKTEGEELEWLEKVLLTDQDRIVALETLQLEKGLTAAQKKEYAELHPMQLFEPNGKKQPMEETFFQALEHHHREGFLSLKLMEPRSYDYNRIKVWDDRLRMPQFKFARSRKLAGETDEAYKARQEVDEAEAREAVMTFVLGLVAEPVPLKYVSVPKAEKAAEVTGRQVLDKFNCAGCHHIRPGIFEFERKDSLRQLEASVALGGNISGLMDDFHFPQSNAWAGPAQPSDRLQAFGYIDPVQSEKNFESDNPIVSNSVSVRLSDAFRFTGGDRLEKNLPAAMQLYLPRDKYVEHRSLGGTFTDLLSPYLLAKNKTKYPTPQNHLPPPLLREGERVQPDWLYKFLLNPGVVRPENHLILRMPKFNMSPEESRALVNYFAAVARVTNPGQGVTYPYVQITQRDKEHWRHAMAEYRKRLDDAKGEAEELKKKLADAEKKAADPKSKTKAADAAKVAELKKSIEYAEKVAKFADSQKGDDQYAVQAYKLVTNRNLCLQCHNVGSITIEGPQAPNLALAAERLRPDWVEQWTAKPPRLFPYEPVMPQNFPNKSDPLQWFDEQKAFVGTPLQQARAVRDILMDSARLSELTAKFPPPPPPKTEEMK